MMGCTRIFFGANQTSTSVCVPYYSLDDVSVFTWETAKHGNLRNLRNMTKEAVLYHGRFCESGFAYRFQNETASCINIVKANFPGDDDKLVR